MRAARFALVFLFAGCAATQTVPGPTGDLTGLTLPLLDDAGVRLAVAGKAGDLAATVLFDSTRELSSASTACFGGAPALLSMVKLETVRGGTVEVPGARLKGLALGGRRYQDIEVAVIEEPGCTVRLGLELLKPYSFFYDARDRLLSVRRSLSDEQITGLRHGLDAEVLTLSEAHGHEWPLCVTRANQGPKTVVTTLVVATADNQSQLSATALSAERLTSLEQMAQLLGEPEASVAPEKRHAVLVDALELSPHKHVGPLWVEAGQAWKTTAEGLLGGDVWGAFDVTFDFAKGLMVLHSRALPQPMVGNQTPERRLVDRFVKWLEEREAKENLPEPEEP